MHKPILGQDSRLFTVLSGGSLSCTLVSPDYDSGNTYIEESCEQLPSDFDISDFDRYIKDLLYLWGKEIDWNLIGEDGKLKVPMEVDSEGVNGSVTIFSKKYCEEGFTSSFLSQKPLCFDDDFRAKSAARHLKLLECDRVVLVDLGWDEISVTFTRRAPGAGESMSSEFDSQEFIVDSSRNRKNFGEIFEGLSAVNVSKNDFDDVIANLYSKRVISSSSQEVWDIIRAHISSCLFSINSKDLKNLGVLSGDNVVLITGDLVRVLPKNYALLAVIDGLQLRGSYRTFIDNGDRFKWGSTVVDGEDFIFPIPNIYPQGYMYISSTKGGNVKSGKNVMKGQIYWEDDGSERLSSGVEGSSRVGGSVPDPKTFVCKGGQMYTFDLKTGEEYQGRIIIEKDRDFEIPKLKEDGSGRFFADFDSEKYIGYVIFDCRNIPVVYGPDVSANHDRVTNWLKGLDIG